jgi:serine/threonine protein kinase
MDDLWDFETEEEFGRGRYASVRPARRKDEKYFEQKDQEPKAAPTDVLQRCSCALKIVDKNEFWRRVVKGRERADTLVRELSVQSTLTAKCGQIPTFLKLRSFFETSDNVVLELELLEGTDLFDYISQEGMLKEEEAALITQDILQSLEAMNRVGLAHRDLKPANILMCNREKDNVSVKVGDFGMSTFVGVDGLLRGRCGTPGYVAPEILTASSGVGYGNKVDMFSAGVILYVMLCGYEPYYGESEKALVDANKLAIVDFPESDWQNVSLEARDLIRQMLKPDPKGRITAKDALEHPWIVTFGTKAIESSGKGSGLNKSIHLPPSDIPDAGACVIV